MADYWKSQDKKYCDFCRCWITDNKPSVEFHENGRRHKENVAKRLRNIQKQSSKNQRETVKVNNALKQMELAALEAYNKDVANHADLSASTAATNKEASGKKLWQEYKSGDGRFYYQNVITNEKVLIPPIGGYTSITEHRKHVYNTGKRQIKAVQKHNLMQERVRSEIEKQEKDEETARHFREKMKERRVEDIPEPVYAPIIPSGKSTPYGHWQTVKESPITEIDLQLPQPEYEAPIVEEYVEEPAPIEFKEKVVENLGSGNVAFKKRKAGLSSKRNIRQRMHDD